MNIVLVLTFIDKTTRYFITIYTFQGIEKGMTQMALTKQLALKYKQWQPKRPQYLQSSKN